MTNEELFDAIAFAFQSAQYANDGYDSGNVSRAKLMLKHLTELLGVQLDRAKARRNEG